MQSALKVKTRVLPGKRVEVCSPELIEGEDVELIILKPEEVVAAEPAKKFASAWDYLQSFERVEYTPEQWAEIEREFYEERNSWGD